ncbi:MAG: PQQ-binding-like beta-propeller repeat protein [Thermoplasmata archaeon]|nr:PQQ-binding-like beta-propeller repeat protein [Thermoplasmata archaeon]
MRRAAAVALVLLLTASMLAVPASDVSADDGDMVLIDMGNGVTYWCSAGSSSTYAGLAEEAAESLGLAFQASGGTVTAIGGMTNHSVGTQQCRWILYVWDGSEWTAGEGTEYSGGTIAWGFYPDASIVPAETPDNPSAWTMHRGDSSMSGSSDSYGTTEAVSPMEWYRTYTSGYVDSSIIVAGDYLYHTTGGAYGVSGADGNPWVYCLDRLTGEIVWSYMMTKGQGYEVTTPLVVGDMLIVTATNWNVYCFDRYTGEVLHTLTLEKDYPYDENMDVAWEGRTFYTGATTPVYDSGAIYFGTSDGHVMAYSVTRDGGFELLWDYDPDDTYSNGTYSGVKGCFYFHAPVIAEVDGTRMLFIGSYEGYAYALDASTGREIWVERMIDLGDDNIPHPGTPGSVGNITVTDDGRLIICCDDGGMSSQDGYVVCVDAATGKGPDGSAYYWKLEVLMGNAVVSDGGFYAFVSPSANGTSTLACADGTEMDLIQAVYRFDMDGNVVWVSEEYSLVKASITLADGIIYTADYSAGSYWPSGGGVTALSAEDGSQIWRLRLSPYSLDSYNMVSVTVIDGKLYVGNDYGAVYCISEVAGKQYGDDGEIVLENGFYHWSWAALIVVVAALFVFLWRFY